MMLPTMAPARAPSLIPLEECTDRGAGVALGVLVDKSEEVIESIALLRGVASCWSFVCLGMVLVMGVPVLFSR